MLNMRDNYVTVHVRFVEQAIEHNAINVNLVKLNVIIYIFFIWSILLILCVYTTAVIIIFIIIKISLLFTMPEI